MRRSLAVLAIVGGCADSTHPLTVHALDASLVAIQQSGQDWQTLYPDDQGVIEMEALSGPFVVTRVCDLGTQAFVSSVLAGDGIDEIELRCRSTTSKVRVSVAPGSGLWASVSYVEVFRDWTQEIPPGTYDVVVYTDDSFEFGPPRFVILRDQQITTDTVLTADVMALGTDMEIADVTTNVPVSEQVWLGTELTTANGTRMRMGGAGYDRAWVFPASALREDDQVAISADVDIAGRSSRSVTQVVDPRLRSLALTVPSGFAVDLAWDGAWHATWQADGDWNDRLFSVADQGLTPYWDVHVWPEYFAAGGSATADIAMPDPRGIPGWNPRWELSSATVDEWYLSLRRQPSANISEQLIWRDPPRQ